MDLQTPLLTGVLLALFTAIQTWINKGRFDALEKCIDHVEGRLDQMSSELAQLRSDLLQVALAVGLRSQPETG